MAEKLDTERPEELQEAYLYRRELERKLRDLEWQLPRVRAAYVRADSNYSRLYWRWLFTQKKERKEDG